MKNVYLDCLRIKSAKEARDLMFHHLELAALLFEMAGSDTLKHVPETVSTQSAMCSWIVTMHYIYQQPIEE